MNLTETQKITLKEAIDRWGVPSQMTMLEEEAQELALAVHKLLNRSSGANSDFVQMTEDVIDELADIFIMFKQAEIILGAHRIDSRINYKLNRLSQRLDKSKQPDELDMKKYAKNVKEFEGFLSQHGYSVKQFLELAAKQLDETSEIYWGCLIGIRFGELTIVRIIDPLENTDWGEFHPICKLKYKTESKPGDIVKWYLK